MAYTQTQMDALKNAIATGTTLVRMPDRSEVQYRTLDEMRKILAMMEKDLGSVRVASFTPSFSKGM